MQGSAKDGKRHCFIEADKKEQVIRIWAERYDRQLAAHSASAAARRSRRRAAGLCIECGKRPLFTANHCEQCRDRMNARLRARKAGAPLLLTRRDTPEAKAAAYAKYRSRQPAPHLWYTRKTLARCLEAYDSMTPSNFRLWLVEQLHEAERKCEESAKQRAARLDKRKRSAARVATAAE